MVIFDSAWVNAAIFTAFPILFGWPLPPIERKSKELLILARQEKLAEKKAARALSKLKKEYGNTEPAFVVSCLECGHTAATVIFRPKERRVTVSGVVHYTYVFGKNKTPTVTASAVVRDTVFAEAFFLARAGNFKKLDSFLKNLDCSDRAVFADGLKNFCHPCGGVYCEQHHDTFPVEDKDGMYDYTQWVCPKGHVHGIDD